MNNSKILHGLCEEILKEFPDNYFDSIVTDPPYGLKFMGKKWDYEVPTVAQWKEVLRVLKPGGYLLSFAGTRTQHRMACNIEDAGFEIRDMIAWVYGSGFPKSLNIGKAVDKLRGNERIVIDRRDVGHDITNNAYKDAKPERKIMDITEGDSEWEGWGTALKPALEPITVARKPIEKGLSVAENCLKWGAGGINIDGCRVETEEIITNHSRGEESAISKGKYGDSTVQGTHQTTGQKQGRFPSNFIHDGSQEVLDLFPQSAGQQGDVRGSEKSCTGDNGIYGHFDRGQFAKRSDSGSAARFFYCAKASKQDRDEGLEGFPVKQTTGGGGGIGNYLEDVNSASGKYGSEKAPSKNNHPTVKPTNLMRYLCRLVTPPKGIILDPFCGSGSTGKAAVLEGFRFVGIDKEIESVKLAEARINVDPLFRKVAHE